ncbi:PleD family two-component system response regulator [Kineobactrum salinum]|uniref:Response regulator n=1 Tax=Kineobactrum salinum TaxID=2708301 RepID=A0A6C0U2H4_9GAMM|nr:response regulator [Kineobactrum salinum]QIB64565.1 response regulator [Kineobactrum salinum]
MPDILLIMRQPGNLRVLGAALESHGHTCIGAHDRASVDQALSQCKALNLALLDVSGFGESVWLVCKKLQQTNVPFIALSARQQLGVSSKTLHYGAMSVLEKPIAKASLLQLIDNITQAEDNTPAPSARVLRRS